MITEQSMEHAIATMKEILDEPESISPGEWQYQDGPVLQLKDTGDFQVSVEPRWKTDYAYAREHKLKGVVLRLRKDYTTHRAQYFVRRKAGTYNVSLMHRLAKEWLHEAQEEASNKERLRKSIQRGRERLVSLLHNREVPEGVCMSVIDGNKALLELPAKVVVDMDVPGAGALLDMYFSACKILQTGG